MRFRLTLILLLLPFFSEAFAPDSLQFGVFGKLKIYKSSAAPKQLVLFVGGDGGWNQGVVDMAIQFTSMDAMVVGIDIRTYLKNLGKQKSTCYYPASDFENLSKFIQKQYHYRSYVTPVLAGYSSGATLVYGTLVQSPANTFAGALVLGFCPDLQIGKPLCPGSGLKSHLMKDGKSYYLEASNSLQEPFIALQGMQDQVCDFKNTTAFLKMIPNARQISLPKVGHGYSVQKNWVPQLRQAFNEIVVKKTMEAKGDLDENMENELKELPVHIVPAAANSEKSMVFMITGDGGYTSFDKGLCNEMASSGMPVVALDALKYFWNEKTPATTTADVEKLVAMYQKKWQRKNVILLGYSFGADALPFVYNNMNKSMQESVRSLVMLSPAKDGDFEIHIMDMLSLPGASKKYDVAAEVNKIKNLRILCFYGSEEEPEIKSEIRNPDVSFYTISGGHHYNNAFKEIIGTIVQKTEK